MGNLLAELGYNEIISADIAANLRKYIALRNPELSADRRAGIFADAINRIVDGRLPPFNAELVKKLKELLFRDITGKAVFSVDCSDVFKAAVKLKTTNPEFLSQLDGWVSDVLKKAVVRESLSDLVIHAHGLMDSTPEDDISHRIDLAEQSTGGLEYSGWDKGTGSLSRECMNVAFAGSPREEAGVCQVEGDEGTGSLSRDCNIQSQDTGTAPGKAINKNKKRKHSLQDGSHQKARFPELLRSCLSSPEPKKVLAASALTTFIIFSAVLTSDTTAAAPDKSNPAGPVFPQVSIEPHPAPYLNEYTFNQDSSTEQIEKIEHIEQMDSKRMKATAYDLSVESCGKKPDHPQYGITRSGTKATVGRTIAVDPEVIPLGSRVHISFPPEYSNLDGIYTAEDTGRLIKGNKIDIFFGEDERGSRKIYESAMEFGVRYVEVRRMD